jgi:hypothetical protein
VLAWAKLKAWGQGREFACCHVRDLQAPRGHRIPHLLPAGGREGTNRGNRRRVGRRESAAMRLRSWRPGAACSRGGVSLGQTWVTDHAMGREPLSLHETQTRRRLPCVPG